MPGLTVTIQDTITSVEISDNTPVVVSVENGYNALSSLSSASDVDMTNVIDGSILVYRASLSTWEATNETRELLVDGGNF